MDTFTAALTITNIMIMIILIIYMINKSSSLEKDIRYIDGNSTRLVSTLSAIEEKLLYNFSQITTRIHSVEMKSNNNELLLYEINEAISNIRTNYSMLVLNQMLDGVNFDITKLNTKEFSKEIFPEYIYKISTSNGKVPSVVEKQKVEDVRIYFEYDAPANKYKAKIVINGISNNLEKNKEEFVKNVKAGNISSIIFFNDSEAKRFYMQLSELLVEVK